MTVTYFHRYRMQYDLREGLFEPATMPAGYELVPWSDDLLNQHTKVKFLSFQNELDATVFPCLGDQDGCSRLMKEISSRQGFLHGATWLVRYTDPATSRRVGVGTVQGIRSQTDVGSIQNIGITPAHRGKGLGSVLVHHSLQGFADAGVRFVTLEVTSHNTGACRLYRKLGFRNLKTVFKSVEIDF